MGLILVYGRKKRGGWKLIAEPENTVELSKVRREIRTKKGDGFVEVAYFEKPSQVDRFDPDSEKARKKLEADAKAERKRLAEAAAKLELEKAEADLDAAKQKVADLGGEVEGDRSDGSNRTDEAEEEAAEE